MNFGGRRSMYKNVFGSVPQGIHYSNLKITNDFGDSTGIKANPKYLSAIWQTSGGGVFAVLPHDQEQRLPDNNIRLFAGHSAPVLDTDWNPFDDDVLVSASGDGSVSVWRVPQDFNPVAEDEDVPHVKPVSKLTGHQKPVRLVQFNPSAGNVLASASTDSSIIIWDISQTTPIQTVRMDKPAASISWDATGKYLVTVPQYGQPSVWDPRLNKSVIQFPTNSTSKARRVIWLGEQDKVVTTGKSFGDGQIALWDVKNPRSPLSSDSWGQASSILTPFWDEGTQMLYVTIKGERTIKYYELHNNELEELFYYQGAESHSGVTFMPKRGVNVRAKELARAFRIIGGSSIEPVPFTLPRTQDAFISEAYPPTVGLTPYTSAQEWASDPSIAGIPVKFSLEGLWDGSGLTAVAKDQSAATSDLKSTSKSVSPPPSSASATKVETQAPKPNVAELASKANLSELASRPVNSRSPVDTKGATSAMASAVSKFADNSSGSDKDDDSSFVDVHSPPARAAKSVAPVSSQSADLRFSAPGSKSTNSSLASSSGATTCPSLSKAHIEKLVSLAEKCKSEIFTAQKSLNDLTTELKSLSVVSESGDNTLKDRINKLVA